MSEGWNKIIDSQPEDGVEVLIFTGVIQQTLFKFVEGGLGSGSYWNSNHPDIDDFDNAVNPDDWWRYPEDLAPPITEQEDV